jgi:hypothetical protein
MINRIGGLAPTRRESWQNVWKTQVPKKRCGRSPRSTPIWRNWLYPKSLNAASALACLSGCARDTADTHRMRPRQDDTGPKKEVREEAAERAERGEVITLDGAHAECRAASAALAVAARR